MIELHPIKFPSTNVHSIGFEGEGRGRLHVQFQNKDGELTTRGYYDDVPIVVYNELQRDRQPGAFIHKHLKGYFTWTVVSENQETVQEADQEPAPSVAKAKPVVKSYLRIPVETPNTVEAIAACIKAQTQKPLF